MSPQSNPKRPLILIVTGMILAGLAFRLAFREGDERDAEKMAEAATRTERDSLDSKVAARRGAVLVRALKQAVADPPIEVAADGVQIMGPGNSDSTADGPRRPHPITKEHRRLFKENNIVGSLEGAMDVGDYDAVRRINERYKNEYPESSTIQSGYDIIADCLEQKTPEARVRAQEYYDKKRASTIRRFVRRHCLE